MEGLMIELGNNINTVTVGRGTYSLFILHQPDIASIINGGFQNISIVEWCPNQHAGRPFVTDCRSGTHNNAAAQ